MIGSATDHKGVFIPDDVIPHLEASEADISLHFKSKEVRVPDVNHHCGRKIPGFQPLGDVIINHFADSKLN